MSKDFRCIFTDQPRIELYTRLFGRDWVAVKSPVPEWVGIEGIGTDLVYLLDIDELTVEEFDRLCSDMAQRFEKPVDEVREAFLELGCPIRFANTYMAVHNAQKWLH